MVFRDTIAQEAFNRGLLLCYKCREYKTPDKFARDGGICKICNLSTTLIEASIDHIIPVSKGGRHTWANVQLAHKICNIRKGVKDVAFSQ